MDRAHIQLTAVISTAAVLLVVKPEFLFGEDLAYTAAETAERVLGFTAICASVLFHSVDSESYQLARDPSGHIGRMSSDRVGQDRRRGPPKVVA